eukprot:XP_014008140.1 PREDICTED: LIM domain only protein 7-like isoform X2 [Salmo salar]
MPSPRLNGGWSLINQLKPGVIKRMNILSTPMAGLDNVNVFLRACGTLGLHEAQLFHPGDLQDQCVEGKRRLKNVLITIYWLGRKAQVDPFYSGPQLNLKAFEGLLGIALSKALEETPRGSVKDSDVSYPEQDDELLPLTQSRPPGYSREDSVESFNSVLSFDSAESPRTLSCISDSILRAGSEDSSSDVEAENCFRMKAAEGRDSGQRNWGNIPAPFQRKKREEKPIKGCIPSLLTRSKSLNDIRRFLSATQVVRQVSEGGIEELSPSAVSQDQLQRVRARVHESEAKWHNDLTKWKLWRHRSNCDLRRKMQERDNIVLMANAGVGTCRSLQEDREEDEESLCSSSYNKVSLATSFKEGSLELRAQTRAPASVKEGSLELRPHTRAPLALSSSVESPYSSGASEPFTTPSLTLQDQGPSAGAVPQSEPLVLGERRRHTPVEPDGAGGLGAFPDSASPFSSQTRAQSISSPALVVSTGRDQTISSPALVVSTGRDQTISMLSNGISTTSDLVNGTGSNLTNGTSSHSLSASMDTPGQALLSTVQSLTSVVAPGHVSAPQRQELHLYRYSSRAPGGGTGVSASLPRGYRRGERLFVLPLCRLHPPAVWSQVFQSVLATQALQHCSLTPPENGHYLGGRRHGSALGHSQSEQCEPGSK